MKFKDGEKGKVEKFLAELTELSEKHGIWLDVSGYEYDIEYVFPGITNHWMTQDKKYKYVCGFYDWSNTMDFGIELRS